MHETSLQQVITDYISGEEIEDTTYEDLRQGIARLLVEDKSYPRDVISTKVPLKFEINGLEVEYKIDFLVHCARRPAILVAFCSGAVASYLQQYLAAARIFAPIPPAFVFVTDTHEGVLMRTSDGKRLDEGFAALPDYDRLCEMLHENPVPEFDEKKRAQARKLVHAFFSLSDGCCSGNCSDDSDS
ncbi:MAG: type I restriction enzyme HsdR N-terminal domain-containing protein [Thermodesulfobacteriota bacterium]